MDKDNLVFQAIEDEKLRQNSQINLIASENYASNDVLMAQGSVMTNKYAEGYPARRYYAGCEYVDVVEMLAIERVCKLFNCSFANVQPHCGSSANQAVFLALLKPGDKVLGMGLQAGGHLTHGSSVNLSGKWFSFSSYSVNPETECIDYDDVLKIAKETKPKLIIAGGSAYTRIIDFEKFRSIADEVGAYLLVDMAHFSGLVAGGVYKSPLPFADVVTSTTHKTLRGPRGGIILTNNEEMAKKIDSAVFPGLQGGPFMHTIAAKAVAFKEALDPSFKLYAKQIINNAKTLELSLKEDGINLVSGGTDSHLLLLNLSEQNLTGKAVEEYLNNKKIVCNKNTVPNEKLSPRITSGIRIGTPACTTRGMKEDEFKKIAKMISHTILNFNEEIDQSIYSDVDELCGIFKAY